MSAGGGQILGRAVHYIDLDDSRFQQGLGRVENTARAGFGRVSQILRGALAVGIGVSAFNSSIFAIRRAFEFAAEGVILFNARLDQTTAAFTKLLGSRAEAEKQFAQLFEFAKRTPFDFDAVLKGATVLQVFGAASDEASGSVAGVGKSVLLTQENLNLFGDAAAATVDVTGSLSNGFKQSTFWIGRMYQALQNGQPIGRAATSLERLGLLLPEVREQLELAAQAGATGDEQFQIFKTSLERFRGLQRIQQESFFTQISTVSDNVTRLLAKAGRPVFDNIVDFLKRVNTELESPAAEAFVDDLTSGVARLANSAKTFLSDPEVQRRASTFLREAGETLQNIVTLVSTLVEVSKPWLAVIDGIVRAFDAVANSLGTNAITMAALIGLAVKFRRELAIGVDVVRGKSGIFSLPRDSKGNALTSNEAGNLRQRQEAELRRQLAVEEERLRRQNAVVERTHRSRAAAQDQVNKNVQGRQERASRAAAALVEKEESARASLLRTMNRETTTRARLAVDNARAAANTQKLTDALTRQKEIDDELNKIGRDRSLLNRQLGRTQPAAGIGLAGQLPNDLTFEQRTLLEKQGQDALERQRSRLRAAQLAAVNMAADSDAVKALNEEITKTAAIEKQVNDLGTIHLGITEAQIKLDKEQNALEAERAALTKTIADARLRDQQLAAQQQQSQLKLADTIAEKGRQQTKAANLATAVALPQGKGKGILSSGPTVQEQARLANASSQLSDRLRKQAEYTERVRQKQAALNEFLNQGGSGYDRFIGVVNRVGQGLFALTLAYEGVNLVTSTLFHDTLPGLIRSLQKYGDTLGHAREEAQAFFEAHKDSPDAADEFQKEVTKTNQLVAEATKRRDDAAKALQNLQERAAKGPTLAGDGGGGVAIGLALADKINDSGIGDANRALNEAQAKLDELIRLQQRYNEEWANLNANARRYNDFLNGTVQITSEEAREFQKMMKEDQRFADLITKMRESSESTFASLGIDGSVTPTIIAKIKADAEQFRDVGRLQLLNFLEGFTDNQSEAFDKAASLASGIFKAMGRDGAVADIEMGNLQIAIAESVDEMSKLGHVTDGTADRIRALAGKEGGDRILALVRKMDEYRRATEALETAQKNLASTEKQVEQEHNRMAAVVRAAQADMDNLRESIEEANRAREEEIDGMRKEADRLRREADDIARGYQKTIDKLNERQKAVQDEADAADKAHQKRIDGLQDEVDALQKVLEAAQKSQDEHSSAAQAVIEGRIDAYRRERGALEELTETLIGRYEAEIGAARRLKDATQDRASAASRDQRKQLLAFDEAIEQARQRGDRAEVARLQKQREAFSNRSGRQVQLAESRAAVARDDFDQRQRDIERQAEDQRLADVEATRNAQTRLDSKQKELEAAQKLREDDRARFEEILAGIQAQIDDQERLAKVAADDYAERIRLQDEQIRLKEEADKEQDKRDEESIRKMQKRLTVVEKAAQVQNFISGFMLKNAQNAVDKADEYAKKIGEAVKALDGMNERWLTTLGLIDEIVRKLNEANQDISRDPAHPLVGPPPDDPKGGLGSQPAQPSGGQPVSQPNSGIVPSDRIYPDGTAWGDDPVPRGYTKVLFAGANGRPYAGLKWIGDPSVPLVPPTPSAPPPDPNPSTGYQSLRVSPFGGGLSYSSSGLADNSTGFAALRTAPASAEPDWGTIQPARVPQPRPGDTWQYNQNAPLGTFHVREEADIDKIAAAVAIKQVEAFTSSRMKGVPLRRVK